MAKELMEIGGFITSGAEIVNHDASLSGNGTVDSPLGLSNDTVLWSGTASKNDTMQLSEPFSSFHYLEIYGSIVQDDGTHNMLPACKVCVDDVVLPASFNIAGFGWWGNISNYKIGMNIGTYASSYSAIQHAGGVFMGKWDNAWYAQDNSMLKINRIVGINRKAQ